MGAHEPFQVPLRRLWNHLDSIMSEDGFSSLRSRC